VASNGGKNVCPASWHVPSDDEWTILTTFLGGEDVAGGKLKETGTTDWSYPNMGATNETGFSALPGGFRIYNGAYLNIGYWEAWWSSTESSPTFAWKRVMQGNGTYLSRSHSESKQGGFAVRCLRD
jgi:uncharacterized protein (TIGR02145 family)